MSSMLKYGSIWFLSISVSIAACHAAGTGSTPVGTAILKHITHQVSGGGSPVKGATPTKSLIVCFNMVAIP